ncbi:MAG: sensor histidine kinase [Clostridium sp.]|uniref:sensor histidine kinase n=1 Tax=Clostridium sp. TaxID=1506 RepID=UPI003216AC8C|nr:sensor histidine kinase [Clostridium sp.]
MDTKLKKSNLFRNIAWIVLFFSITVSIISGIGAVGQYRIYKNPYTTHSFINNMADLDSTLARCLYTLDGEGEVNENYLEVEFENRKAIRKEQYDWEMKELESSSIRTDSKESYESMLLQYKNDINKRYEEDLKNLEKELRLNAQETANDFKTILNNLSTLQFFVKDVKTGKVLTNMESKMLEEVAVTNDNADEYEIFIQTGVNSRIYPYASENAALLYDCTLNPSNTGTIKIYKANKNIIESPSDYIYQAKSESENAIGTVKDIIILCGALVVSSLISLVYLYKTRRNSTDDFSLLNKIYRKIPLEISIIAIIAACIITFEMIQSSVYYYSYGTTNNVLLLSSTWFEIVVCGIIVSLIGILIYLSIRNIKEGKPYEYIRNHSLICILSKWMNNFYLNVKGRKFVILNLVLSLIWIGIAMVFFYQSYYSTIEFMIVGGVMLVIYVIAVMAYWFKMDKCMINIYMASSKIRQGDFHQNIKEEGPATLRLTAENLNNIKDGLEKAINSATRNEQLKTELITNVSHDLKTPLTSIINYIDLLKDENATEEEKKKYIDIITKKSARLKILIEDLFEASKAASRTMELNMDKADIVSLVRQTLGEFEEKISNSNLKFVVKLPEEKAYVNIDGKRTWRVLENLLSNILKYSMDNTRVYIEVIPTEEDVKIVMRNISAFEMDFNEEDILERFKRGDGSRHTEGSGLGLSIAKSLTELQDGTFKIDIDGDLFKVTVTFKKYVDNMKAE